MKCTIASTKSVPLKVSLRQLSISRTRVSMSYAEQHLREAIQILERLDSTAKVADECVVVPTVNPENVTPHSEAFQAVVWHLIVSHPKLKTNQTKWEAVATADAR